MKTNLPLLFASALCAVCCVSPCRADDALVWVPDVAKPAVEDVQRLPTPDHVHLASGLLGTRVMLNETKRLLEVDEAALLAGYRSRPGGQAWVGEHVGKFLHAGSLAWANTNDPKLREKIDRVAAELIKTQEADGYLGTYTADKRFQLISGSDWDVWSHKYNLMGLLTYHQVTGNKAALAASVKVGDLLCNTFGPGKKDILTAGKHTGMASTSVLEPMVLLYRITGDKKYLDFALYLTTAWEQPNGPHIISRLTEIKQVNKTGNAKAYEMLSNLVGLCELYRVTGDRKFLTPLLNAWEDITTKRMYITGSASQGEHFHEDYHLPNGLTNSSETCVTVTWMQLNAQLLRLTGEPKFATELERSAYNHLSASQKPTGDMWCYYTALEGGKPYGKNTNCCLSSGPRGMALIPSLAYGMDASGVVVNLIEPGQANLTLPGGEGVALTQKTGFPATGDSMITVGLQKAADFTLKVRVPPGVQAMQIQAGDLKLDVKDLGGEYMPIKRTWLPGDTVQLKFAVPFRVIKGEHTNEGKVTFEYGPSVLAVDAKVNADLPDLLQKADNMFIANFSIPDGDANALHMKTIPVAEGNRTWAGDTICEIDALDPAGKLFRLKLGPFAVAGGNGGRYMVWLPRAK